MDKWYNRAWLHILEELKVDQEKGIDESEIDSRKNEFGNNIIFVEKKESVLKILLKQIINPFIIYILISIIFSFYVKTYFIAIIDVVFIIGFGAIFYMNYKKTYEFIDELDILNNINVKIIRNYTTQLVKSSELVTGDIVYLSKNSIVPADIRILECKRLKVDEYLVTGEREPSSKYSTKIEEKDIPLSIISNMAFMGSKVISGEAVGVVVEVGEKTQIGKIISFVRVNKSGEEVLKNTIIKYLNKIVVYILTSLLAVGVIHYLYYKNLSLTSDVFMNAFIVSYPIWAFIALFSVAYYELNSLRKKGIHINSLETLSKISHIHGIFMNKLGALSKEECEVRRIYTDGTYVNLYDIEAFKGINASRLIDIAYLASSSNINSRDKAINSFIEESGILDLLEEGSRMKIFDIPYDNSKRLKTSVNKIDNFYRAHVIGDVDAILDSCIHIMKNGFEIELTREEIDDIKNAHIEMSNSGLRVVALAYRNFNYEPSIKENIESNLVLVGLIAIKNEMNISAKDDIGYCKDTGILPIIFTDDDKLSCLYTLKALGIKGGLEKIQSGIEIDYTTHEEFVRNIHKYRVFSRINSYHKYIILKQLKERGTNVMIFLDNMTHIPLMNLSCLDVGVGKNLTNMIKKLCHIYIEDQYLHNMLLVIKRCKFIDKGKNYMEKFLLSITPLTTVIAFAYIVYFNGENLSLSYALYSIIPAILALKMFYSGNKIFNIWSYIILAFIFIGVIALIYFNGMSLSFLIFFIIYVGINMHLYRKVMK